jgi:glycosyltransferase involved in cell wall biosynthesis
MDRSRIAIIIPAYNEQETIAQVISEVSVYGNVFVVDDGSNDNTASISKSAGARVIQLSSNQGYDAALAAGLREACQAEAKFIITFDADGQHKPKELQKFIDAWESGENLVLGIRPCKARLAEKIMGLYYQLRFGVRDILCGFKGYDSALIFSMNFNEYHGLIGSELTFKFLKSGGGCKQIQIDIDPRQDDKPRFGSVFRANIKILAVLIKVLLLDLGLSKGV